jgi:hypothetical protein
VSTSVSGAQVSHRLRAILSCVAVAAVAVPAWVVTHPPAMPQRPAALRALAKRKVIPATVVPAVEPVELVDLTPQDAKAFNDSVPFVTGPNPAARPFHIAGDAASIERATDCLAAAEIYEAGNDPEGQRAVMQVVLNRLRHPAFPKTVCGVVFEGQERSTGCQFTFTCDGALTRWSPSEVMWRDARVRATQALTGQVYKPVGYATHYHTDWVVPYWQSSLDKIAAVHSHLFFRWAGWWGTPPAFNRTVASVRSTRRRRRSPPRCRCSPTCPPMRSPHPARCRWRSPRRSSRWRRIRTRSWWSSTRVRPTPCLRSRKPRAAIDRAAS